MPKALWRAVRVVRDPNIAIIPNNMYINNEQIKKDQLKNVFVMIFKNKIDTLVSMAIVDPNAYNGKN